VLCIKRNKAKNFAVAPHKNAKRFPFCFILLRSENKIKTKIRNKNRPLCLSIFFLRNANNSRNAKKTAGTPTTERMLTKVETCGTQEITTTTIAGPQQQ
jgi:hypothetical protein